MIKCYKALKPTDRQHRDSERNQILNGMVLNKLDLVLNTSYSSGLLAVNRKKSFQT